MKRQLNFRFVLLMLAAVSVLAVSGYFLHGYQLKRNAGYLLEQSRIAHGNKDLPTALRYLSHYLTLRPDDARARAQYGVIVASKAEGYRQKEAAYLTLERALRDDPNLDKALRDDPDLAREAKNADAELAALASNLMDVRRTTADLAMQLYQFADALVHIQKLLEERPNDADLLVLLARCEDEGGRHPKAIEVYVRAKANDPHFIAAYTLLASLYRRIERAPDADRVIAELLEKNAQSPPARVAAAAYFLVYGPRDEVRKQLEAAKALAPDDVDVLLLTVQVANAEGKPTEAEAALRRGLQLYPDRPVFRIGLAGQELRAGHRDIAVTLLREAVEKLAKQPGELWAIADLFIDANEVEDARKVIERLQAGRVDAAMIDYLEARIKLSVGKLREAEELLLRCERLFLKNADLGLRTEVLLAECYQRLGKPDLQLKAAEQAVKFDPLSPHARLTKANALLDSGRTDEALDEYKRIVDRDQKVRLLVARLMLWQNRQRPAEQQNYADIARVIESAPASFKEQVDFVLADVELLATEGYVLVARGRALIAEGSKPQIAQGEKLQAAGQRLIATAKQRAETARDKDPKDTRTWLVLASLATGQGRPEDGLAVLEQAKGPAGDQVSLRLARASLLLRLPNDAKQLKLLEAGSERFPESERAQLFQGLAEAYARTAAPADAERLLRQALALHPGDLKLLARLFDFVAANENVDEIADLQKQIQEAEGDEGAIWRLAAAYGHWLRHRKDNTAADLDRAKTLLAAAGRIQSQWFRVPLLEGEIADATGQSDLALEKYKAAFAMGASQPALVTRATYLMTSRNRLDEARQMIDEFRRRRVASSPDLDRLDIANQLGRGGDSDEMIKQLANAVPADSTKIEDQLFRGGFYASLGFKARESEKQARDAGKPVEAKDWATKSADWAKTAEAAYRKALAIAPAVPEAWVPLVRFLVQFERTDDAKKEIEKAAAAIPAEKKSRILAACHELVGDREQARQHYEAAGADPIAQRSLATFYLGGGEVAKGTELLRKLLLTPDVPTKRWARRTLALTLSSSGSYADNLEAEGLLNSNVGERAGELEDERILALIKALRPGGRTESIKQLESLFLRANPSPSEEFLLARLYELDGDWTIANGRFLGLLARAGGDSPAYMAHYIRSLIRRKDFTNAAAWLARLKDKDKASVAAIEFQARIWVEEKKTTEAANLLKGYARDTYASQKNPNVLRAVGIMLATLKLLDDAEMMLQQYIAEAEAKSPAAVLVMADFQARHRNQVGRALEICSNALPKVNPEVVAQVTVAAVRLGEASPAHFAEAERILQKAIALKPDSLDIQVSLADLRDAQGRYDEAKAKYREILDKAPRATLAMNNLAWLLALQEKSRDPALELMKKAILQQGPDGNLLDTLGVIQATLGDPAQAVVELNKAIAQEPLPERYFHLAQAYRKAGNVPEAARALRKARELDLKKSDLHKLEWQDYDAMMALIEGK